MATLTIGRLARQADVNIETIRYYQRVGLISQPAKPENGYRIYPTTTIHRIRFIKRAQKLGFKLLEIADLLELSSENCEDVRNKAEQKRIQIKRQIDDLVTLKDSLDDLIEACKSGKKNACCPIVEALTAEQA
jgi:MerR family mercuric resistance operon transcriptional regulator